MTKRALKIPPLILVHLEITWSGLPDPKVFDSEQLIEFHRRMSSLGLPKRQSLKQEFQKLELSQTQSSVTPGCLIRHIFTNGGGDCQIEVNCQKLVVRQTVYDGFDALLKLANQVIETLQNISDISNSVVDIFSLHYVDLFLPSRERSLEDYISPNDLIPYSPKVSNVVSERSTSMSVLLLEKNEQKIRDIALRFNKLKMDAGKFPLLVPAELQEPNQEAVMQLNIPEVDFMENCDYGLMDIRHAIKYLKQPKFSEINHDEQLKALYQTSSDVFWSVLSNHALNEWGMVQYE